MKKYMMVAWVVCVALAFGLSGCTADDVSDEGQKGNGNGSENADNCLSFVVSEKANTRMGGVEDVNRIKFVWTENDYKYLYCDVEPNGSAANWKQPSMQYTLKADEHHPTLLKINSHLVQLVMLTMEVGILYFSRLHLIPRAPISRTVSIRQEMPVLPISWQRMVLAL